MGTRRDRLFQIPDNVRGSLRRITGGWTIYREDLSPAEELSAGMRRGATPTASFFLLLCLSGTIATLGLLGNSAPAIIGAMIIAPLMTPIVSLAYAVARFDRGLALLSMMTIAAGAVTTIAIAYAGVEVVGAHVAGSEILARTSPSLLDLGVALAAGCAGALAQTRPSIANSIAGVAIAVALVPPLAVTGIGLALGRAAVSETGRSLGEFGLTEGGTAIASGAFLLFLTNLIGIIVVAGLVFIIDGYGIWKKGLAAIAIICIGSFGMMPPLNRAMYEIYVKNRALDLYARTARQVALGNPHESAIRLERIRVGYRDGVLHVTVGLFATRDRLISAQQRLDAFRDRLSRDLREPVILEAEVIPVEVLQLKSGNMPAK